MDEAALADQRLMRRLANGETSVLASLYDKYSAHAYGLALEVCREKALAEEAVQMAFALLREGHWRHDVDRSDFGSWFLTVVRNCCFDILYKKGRRRPWKPGEAGKGAGASFGQALASLPDSDREMILSAYLGGYTHLQMAEEYDMPPETIKRRLRLGLERLSQTLIQGGARDEM